MTGDDRPRVLPVLVTDPLQLLDDAVLAGLGFPDGAAGGDAAAARRLLEEIRAGYPGSVVLRDQAELLAAADVDASVLRALLAAAGFRDYAELQWRATDAENQTLARPDQRFARRLGGRPRASLLARLVEHETTNVARTLRAATDDGLLEQAAARLVSARNRYVVGERKSYAFAHLLAADLTAVLNHVTLVDGVVNREPDVLIDAGADDVAVLFSLRRYAATTLRLARRFADRGVGLIAVTDAADSPIAALADLTLVAHTGSESFADSPTAVVASCHALATLAAARAKGARRRLAKREELNADLWTEPTQPGARPNDRHDGNGDTAC
jgi:DNA-binding MurR/RpiR family transcriptional regulator